MKKIIFLGFMIFLFLLHPVLASPSWTNPSNVVFEKGLIINAPFFEYHMTNSDIEIHFRVFNSSNGLQINNSLLSCKASFMFGNGTDAYLQESVPVYLDHFVFHLDGKNMSIPGEYAWSLYCNNSNMGGFLYSTFMVTDWGENPKEIPIFPIIFGVSMIVALYLFIAFNLKESKETPLIRLFLILLSFSIAVFIPYTLSYYLGGVSHLFFRAYLWLLRIIWIMIFVWFIYYLYENYLIAFIRRFGL